MDKLFQEYSQLEKCLETSGTISTSSAYLRFDNSLDIGSLSEHFTVRVNGSKKNKKAIYKSFQNSVTVVFRKGLCAKVFRMGCQICGCKGWNDVLEAYQCLESKLKVSVVDASIHLFNVNVKLGASVDLQQLFGFLKQNPKYMVSYDREEYSGLKLKTDFEGKILTCLVFSSGSIILTGCKNHRELAHLYMLVDQIKSHINLK